MPIAALTAAATVGGALINKSASDKASKAATGAATENNQLEREIYTQQRSDLLPYVQGGYPAVSALQHYLGLDRPASAPRSFAPASSALSHETQGQYRDRGTGTGTQAVYPDKTGMVRDPASVGPYDLRSVGGPAGRVPNDYASSDTFQLSTPANGQPQGAAAGGQGGGVDWMQYLQDNPDALANYNEIHASGRTDQLANDPVAFAQYHYQSDGSRRTLPTLPAATAAQDGQGDAPEDPQYGPAVADRPTFKRPDVGAGPSAPDFSSDAFMRSPSYKWGMDEGMRSLNAAAGAGKMLQSGDAGREAIKFGQNYAGTKYNEWVNQQLSEYNALRDQYNTNRNVDNTNFETDRGYGTGAYESDRGYNTTRYDTKVSDLFRLAGLGSGTAATLGGFGSNYAGAVSSNNNSAASATGNAAIAGANSTNGMIGNALSAYTMYRGLNGGGGLPSNGLPGSNTQYRI
jgi:hypothetical protein